MDEFAQTREPENLFADDFTPITKPIPTHTALHQSRRGGGYAKNHSSTTTPKPAANPPFPNPNNPTADPNLPSSSNADSTPTIRPPTAVRGDRSATGGINKPKLTESELSSRLAAVKLNNARREEAHRAAEADEASFHHREAQASQKRREEGAARRVMEGEREKNRLRKLGARGGREWDEGKQEEDISSDTRGGSQYRRGAHGGTTAFRGNGGGGGGEHDETEGGYGPGEFSGRGFGRRGGGGGGGRARGGDRTRGERGGGGGRGGSGGGGRGRGGTGQHQSHHSSSSPAYYSALNNTETEFPSLLPQPPTKNPSPSPPSLPPSSAPPPSPPHASNQQNLDGANDDPPPPPTLHKWKPDVEPFSPLGEKQSWSDEVEAKTSAAGGG